jgi:hypothetical protein
MKLFAYSESIAVTQAKLIRKDGSVKYYLSKPKLKLFDIKNRLWVKRRIKQMKKERI